jgi:hypothetical protein
MHNLSQEEMDALSFHEEVVTSDWIRLKRKLFIRTFLGLVITLTRSMVMISNPQMYFAIVYPTTGVGVDNLASLVYPRLLIACIFFAIYLYALKNNLYLRSLSMTAVVIVVALFWSDMQVYIIGGFSQFTAGIFFSLALRLLLIYLIIANYIDIRR